MHNWDIALFTQCLGAFICVNQHDGRIEMLTSNRGNPTFALKFNLSDRLVYKYDATLLYIALRDI